MVREWHEILRWSGRTLQLPRCTPMGRRRHGGRLDRSSATLSPVALSRDPAAVLLSVLVAQVPGTGLSTVVQDEVW